MSVIAVLALAVVGKYVVGGQGGYRNSANLVQGLSISTEIKYLVSEYWATTGDLPCEASQLDIDIPQSRGPSVLSAIELTDCGQITLLYNEESGMPGRRMVLQADETAGELGLELAWGCWTPDFPDIEKRVPRCRYEDRQLAEISIPDAVVESADNGNISASKAAAVATEGACKIDAAIYRPVFTDAVEGRRPKNHIVSFAPERKAIVFFYRSNRRWRTTDRAQVVF